MLKDVLISFAPKGLGVLKQSIQKVSVTGKTLQSLRFIVDSLNGRLTYYGRGFMEALEKGRGPRKQSAYGNFDTNLEDWLKAKGFQRKKTKSGKVYYKLGSSWFTAKALAWKINKQGDKTFRSDQVKEVYTKPMEEFTEELKQAIVQDQKEEFKNKVLLSLK